MISSLASPQITAHACGVDDDAPQTEILFFRWITLTERCRVIFHERRSFPATASVRRWLFRGRIRRQFLGKEEDNVGSCFALRDFCGFNRKVELFRELLPP
jgi:hypothetical protein